MDQYDITKREVNEVLEAIDLKMDEYSKSIYGYEETLDSDMLFEEYVEFLNKLKYKLETALEFITSE